MNLSQLSKHNSAARDIRLQRVRRWQLRRLLRYSLRRCWQGLRRAMRRTWASELPTFALSSVTPQWATSVVHMRRTPTGLLLSLVVPARWHVSRVQATQASAQTVTILVEWIPRNVAAGSIAPEPISVRRTHFVGPNWGLSGDARLDGPCISVELVPHLTADELVVSEPVAPLVALRAGVRPCSQVRVESAAEQSVPNVTRSAMTRSMR